MTGRIPKRPCPGLADLQSIGKYALRGTLGRGAMGVVYDGWDAAIDRRVAIKTVKLAQDADEETHEALARFKREAQAAGRLIHPNIVGVYDYGETDEVAYIVMEFVEGRSLKSVIDQEKRLPPAEAEAIMAQVLAGLAYSHSRGVIHRDIKPANIMLTAEGQVKIADFGVARIESSTMTSVGMMIGTPAYMPPEQYLGEPADARSDIYAAGIMLFHLLTGERPYEGNMTSIMQKVLSTDPPPTVSARAGLPTVFDAVIGCAIAKAPAARYPTAAAFAQALHGALLAAEHEPDVDATLVAPGSKAARAAARQAEAASEPPRGKAPPSPTAAAMSPAGSPPGPRGSRMVPLLGGAAALLLLAAGGAFFALRPSVKPDQAAPRPAPTLHGQEATLARPDQPPSGASPTTASPMAGAAPPSPAAMQAALRAAFADLPCTALSVSADAGLSTTVSGLAGTAAFAAAQGAAGRVAPGARIAWSAITVQDPFCPAVDAVRLASAGAGGKLPVSIGGETGLAHLRFGNPIEPRIGAPDFKSFVTLDYFSADGGLYHFPTQPAASDRPASQASVLGAGAVVTVPASQIGCALPPYGKDDLMVVIASSRPLFPADRPFTEPPQAYLPALEDAIRRATAAGSSIAAGTLALETTPLPPDESGAVSAGMKNAVASQPSNLLALPKIGARKSGQLARCERLVVLPAQGLPAGWLKVRSGSTVGWIQKTLVAIE